MYHWYICTYCTRMYLSLRASGYMNLKDVVVVLIVLAVLATHHKFANYEVGADDAFFIYLRYIYKLSTCKPIDTFK